MVVTITVDVLAVPLVAQMVSASTYTCAEHVVLHFCKRELRK